MDLYIHQEALSNL